MGSPSNALGTPTLTALAAGALGLEAGGERAGSFEGVPGWESECSSSSPGLAAQRLLRRQAVAEHVHARKFLNMCHMQ